MAVTNDIKSWRIDAEESLVAYPVGANVQLYVGAIALVSGSGAVTTGFLKNAGTAGSADLVAGIISEPAGGTLVQTGPGILGGTTDGLVWVNVRVGTFMIQSGTGADALTAALVGKQVFYHGENNVGPIADATSNAGARPVLGILMPQDPGFANGFLPGSNYWPVKLNVIGGPDL